MNISEHIANSRPKPVARENQRVRSLRTQTKKSCQGDVFLRETKTASTMASKNKGREFWCLGPEPLKPSKPAFTLDLVIYRPTRVPTLGTHFVSCLGIFGRRTELTAFTLLLAYFDYPAPKHKKPTIAAGLRDLGLQSNKSVLVAVKYKFRVNPKKVRHITSNVPHKPNPPIPPPRIYRHRILQTWCELR